MAQKLHTYLLFYNDLSLVRLFFIFFATVRWYDGEI